MLFCRLSNDAPRPQGIAYNALTCLLLVKTASLRAPRADAGQMWQVKMHLFAIGCLQVGVDRLV